MVIILGPMNKKENVSRVSPTVLTREEVLSWRHLPSMLVLAASAGAVNAGALGVAERYVSHVTGTLTLIGTDFGEWWLMLEYLLVLVAFIAGAATSVAAVQGRAMRGKQPVPIFPLLGTALALLVTAALGEWGYFGAIGGKPEEPGDFAFLSVLGFAMGLLNATVAGTTALAVRPTHMTGPTTDFAVALAAAWYAVGEERLTHLKMAGLRGGTIAAFVVGAAVMFPLLHRLGFEAFALPAALVLFAAERSFAPRPLPRTAEVTP